MENIQIVSVKHLRGALEMRVTLYVPFHLTHCHVSWWPGMLVSAHWVASARN